jgi:hypothetical protein
VRARLPFAFVILLAVASCKAIGGPISDWPPSAEEGEGPSEEQPDDHTPGPGGGIGGVGALPQDAGASASGAGDASAAAPRPCDPDAAAPLPAASDAQLPDAATLEAPSELTVAADAALHPLLAPAAELANAVLKVLANDAHAGPTLEDAGERPTPAASPFPCSSP